MFKKIFFITIIVWTSLLTNNPVFAEYITNETSLAHYISHQYRLATFGIEESTPIETNTAPKEFWNELKKNIDPEIKTLSPREVQEIAFSIATLNNTFQEKIIDRSFINKLEIISGGENQQENLFGRIFNGYINTALGKAYTALTLCHPTTDITILYNRQNTIAHLASNKTYTKALDHSLKGISLVETRTLEPWCLKPLIKPERVNAYYYNETASFLNSFRKWRNTNSFLLNKTISKYLLPTWNTLSPLAIPCATTYHFVKKTNIAQKFTHSHLSAQVSLGIGIAFYEYIICSMSTVGKMIQQTEIDIINHIQEGLMALASHMKECEKLSSLITKNKELLASFPSLQPLADFNNKTKRSNKLNKLLNILNTNTFVGNASYYTSITGRVLAAYKLMQQVKNELAPVFAAVGELDMYVATAKLYNAHKDKNARYCMVDFIEESATPCIDAQNFWNPFINANNVIVNNATFNETSPNSILTGPNTGGKSTVIKAIMVNILMAQTFGIAPATYLALTPFSKLNCFMNIADDIATGASLFKSEVMRAKSLLDMVQSLETSEFSFVIIDEIFTGTSPKEGESAALRFAKKLGCYSNNCSIIATHYPKMVDLETETNGMFHNHHVEILRNKDESLNRTFKLKNGPSFFNVAFDILEEEGLFV